MAPIAYKEMNGWKAAQESVTVTTNQYKAGTVNYLNVVTV
jgi:outer membrane protein TolC